MDIKNKLVICFLICSIIFVESCYSPEKEAGKEIATSWEKTGPGGGESWESATKDNGIPRKWMNSTYWLTLDQEVKGRIWLP